jgi:Family of unknown function (DUF5989)
LRRWHSPAQCCTSIAIRWEAKEGSVGSFVSEFWDYLKRRKKIWLVPILTAMVVLGGLIVLTQGSAVAPFIYALF